MVRGTMAARIKNPEVKGGPKWADYVLYARPKLPIAVVKRNEITIRLVKERDYQYIL